MERVKLQGEAAAKLYISHQSLQRLLVSSICYNLITI